LTKIECVLRGGNVHAYSIAVKCLLSSLENVFLLCSKVEYNFCFLRRTEHTFVYACFRTCRATLNMNSVRLRKTVSIEYLIAIILTSVTVLVI